MKKLHGSLILQELCRATKRFGMLISTPPDVIEYSHGGMVAAAPYLSYIDDMQLISNGFGIILFDSKEEMQQTYQQTVGDDGPTSLNDYSGPTRVYALTCSD